MKKAHCKVRFFFVCRFSISRLCGQRAVQLLQKRRPVCVPSCGSGALAAIRAAMVALQSGDRALVTLQRSDRGGGAAPTFRSTCHSHRFPQPLSRAINQWHHSSHTASQWG